VRKTIEDHPTMVAPIWSMRAPIRRGKYIVVRPLVRDGLVIAAIVGLAKADASAIGVVAPALKSHLHIGEAELGGLASLASGTGALCALPAGTLVDRRHRVAVVTVALVAWSLALGVAGFAEGFALLAVSRVISGGLATIARPVAVSLAGDLFHPVDRGRALAALDTGQAIGTAVCFLLGALAVRALDWRWLFWWLGLAGLALAAVARRTHEPLRTGPPGPPLIEVLKALLMIRTNRTVLVADSVGNFFYAGAASFSVLFITSRYGLTTATVDVLAPILAVGVIGGILIGGRTGDRLTRRHGGSRRLMIAAGCQLATTGIFAVGLLQDSVVLAATCLFVGATVLGGAGPCLDAVRVDIVGPEIRGRAEAARGLLMLGSSALGPLTFGLVASGFGGRGDGIALRDAFFVMLVPLAAGALVLFAAVRTYPGDARAAGTFTGSGMLEQ
jgi:MFS family permease